MLSRWYERERKRKREREVHTTEVDGRPHTSPPKNMAENLLTTRMMVKTRVLVHYYTFIVATPTDGIRFSNIYTDDFHLLQITCRRRADTRWMFRFSGHWVRCTAVVYRLSNFHAATVYTAGMINENIKMLILSYILSAFVRYCRRYYYFTFVFFRSTNTDATVSSLPGGRG